MEKLRSIAADVAARAIMNSLSISHRRQPGQNREAASRTCQPGRPLPRTEDKFISTLLSTRSSNVSSAGVRLKRNTTNHATWRPVAIIMLEILRYRKNYKTSSIKNPGGQSIDGRRNHRRLQKSILDSSAFNALFATLQILLLLGVTSWVIQSLLISLVF